jgi:hypothetical protein
MAKLGRTESSSGTVACPVMAAAVLMSEPAITLRLAKARRLQRGVVDQLAATAGSNQFAKAEWVATATRRVCESDHEDRVPVDVSDAEIKEGNRLAGQERLLLEKLHFLLLTSSEIKDTLRHVLISVAK